MNSIKNMLQDKNFMVKTFTLAIPVTLQNLLNNLLNLADILIVGHLGETSVAAVGLANKVFFVFSLLMFGICSGSSILSSQYYGKREINNIKRVLRISLLIGVAGSFLFVIPGIFCPKFVMSIFTDKADMITIGAAYLGVIAISYPVTAVTNAYTAVLRSMNYVKAPVIITSIAIFLNIVLNYCLVFGKFGLPVMGVAGSALATVVARIFELILLQLVIRSKKVGDDGIGDFVHGSMHTEESNQPFLNKAFIQKYLYTAAPVIVNEFMWGLGVTMYSLVYGRMGNAATAAITMTNTVEQMGMVFLFGVSNAAAVILGNELGADELKKAEEHAKNYLIMLFILSLGIGLMIFLLRDVIISVFPASELVQYYMRWSIAVFSLYLPIRAVDTLIIVAILRSGGDTKAALFLDVSGVWLIGIPMALLGGFVLHLPIYCVYAMVMTEEIYKTIFGFMRYRKKKWLKNIVSEGL
jgi:putative efflux protein, MATE family